MRKNIIFVTQTQKVLYFLLKNPTKDFTLDELQVHLGEGKQWLSLSISELQNSGFVSSTTSGYYGLNYKNPVVKKLFEIKEIIQQEANTQFVTS